MNMSTSSNNFSSDIQDFQCERIFQNGFVNRFNWFLEKIRLKRTTRARIATVCVSHVYRKYELGENTKWVVYKN